MWWLIKKESPRMWGDVASIGDGLFFLEGVERPTLTTKAKADGFQKVPEFVGLPLGVVDPSDTLVVNGDEVIRGVTSDSPGVGTTSENLSLRGSGGHV